MDTPKRERIIISTRLKKEEMEEKQTKNNQKNLQNTKRRTFK